MTTTNVQADDPYRGDRGYRCDDRNRDNRCDRGGRPYDDRGPLETLGDIAGGVIQGVGSGIVNGVANGLRDSGRGY